MSKRIVIGLAGNPNAGKTTLFNELTGGHQHVGNYPGVTVERKEGLRQYNGYDLHIVDLPGTYSLTAYSAEELVARDFVVDEQPDVVIDVVDASNLERNLYLTTQFLELEQPLVVALNMMDVVENEGKRIDYDLLAGLLGVPAVPVVAAKRKGLEELLETVIQVAEERRRPRRHLTYGPELEEHLQEIAHALASVVDLGTLSPHWVAVKLLEGDAVVRKHLGDRIGADHALFGLVDRARLHINEVVGDDAEIALADRRYGFISGAVREAMRQGTRSRRDWSDAVDRYVVSRVLGLPIFVLLMWAMFEMVFRLGAPPMGWIETGFTALGQAVSQALPVGDLRSLLVDGVISGVGGVLVFVPNIALLFLAISLFEDSGYMARAAFVVDRIMHRVGLHGKSFIPMLVGFGCNVPAVMATRTLSETRDRIVTILVVPLMSCGARLPVYILLAGAFFPASAAGKVIFSIYALGVVLAMVMAWLFRSVLLKGPTTPFVMELPPYRMPTVKGVAIHVWERAWMYVKKAGTVILAFAVVMWFLMSYPRPEASDLVGLTQQQVGAVTLEHSFAGRVGKTIEPVMRPLGFDWQTTVALIAGLGAKEVFVSTLATAYSLGGGEKAGSDLREALRTDPHFSPLTAYTLMVFILLYIPCMSSVVVIWRETGTWKWAAFTVAYTCVLAWTVAFVVHSLGLFLGLR
ncbi:ferrous iron transport protein B [bacterium]|nr:ferrous iron transport protein B [bacterium]